jgi:opacity protein-like surface antigen
MKSLKIILLVVFSVWIYVVNAQQGETKFSFGYYVALPMGDFKNSVSATSYRGFNAAILHGVSDKVSVGLASGFQDFYQKNLRQLYHFSDGSDISAVVTYSVQTIPILADVTYNFNPEATIQPYAAIGVGGNLVSYNQLFGEFGDQQAKFGFAARPEAGVFIPFKNKTSGFRVGASYNIMPFKEGDLKNLNSLGIYGGFSVPLRK